MGDGLVSLDDSTPVNGIANASAILHTWVADKPSSLNQVQLLFGKRLARWSAAHNCVRVVHRCD